MKDLINLLLFVFFVLCLIGLAASVFYLFIITF